jgi:hypothetical protein
MIDADNFAVRLDQLGQYVREVAGTAADVEYL